MRKIKPYQHKAQYYETDQMGIVHHSNYIRWFEEARTDLLEQVGFSYKKMEELGVISPVLGVECEYKSMVHFQDVVTVFAKVSLFDGIRFSIDYEIRDSITNELRTIGQTKHCLLNREMKPMRLQREHKDVYDLFMELAK